jgi:hypothetical protein
VRESHSDGRTAFQLLVLFDLDPPPEFFPNCQGLTARLVVLHPGVAVFAKIFHATAF